MKRVVLILFTLLVLCSIVPAEEKVGSGEYFTLGFDFDDKGFIPKHFLLLESEDNNKFTPVKLLLKKQREVQYKVINGSNSIITRYYKISAVYEGETSESDPVVIQILPKKK